MVETREWKVGELVKKFQMNDPTVGNVGKLVRFGQEEHRKPEQGAMLAGAGEEEELIKVI